MEAAAVDRLNGVEVLLAELSETLTGEVDDRPEVTRSSESDHSNLFAETADNQQTLTSDDAAMQCLFDE